MIFILLHVAFEDIWLRFVNICLRHIVEYLSHVVSLLKILFLFLLASNSPKRRWPLLFTLILSSRESEPISCHECTVFSFACVHTSYRDRQSVQGSFQRAGENGRKRNKSKPR